jgi:copper(I)-binding protein
MKMDKDVMRMSPVGALELPAGKTVELKPGGYHVMLMDLKNPLADKSNIPLTLTFEDAKGQKSQMVLQVPVRAMSAMATHKH